MRWLLAAVACVALALAALEIVRAPDGGAVETPRRNETPLPRFEGPLLGGGVWSTDSIGRRRAVLYAFSTRDRRRADVAAMVQRLEADSGHANIALVGIARERSAAAVQSLVARLRFGFPIVLDADGSIARRLRLPDAESAIIVVDAEGYMVGGFAGLQGEGPDVADLYETELRRLLLLEKQNRPATIALGLRPAAPDVRLQALDGAELRTESLRGKVLVLVFFLPSCPHCHEALRFVQQLAKRVANPDLQILAVSVRNQAAAIQSMARDQGLELPFYVDGDGSAQHAYAHAGIVPDLIVIDRNGLVIARHRGSGARIESLLTMEVRHALGVENPLLLARSGYNGEESCRICHEREHATWSLTTHAYAFETLVRHGQERNPECLGCHVVGWNEAGGYSLESPQAHLQGVQCENCHGRGGPHQSPDFAKKGFEATCLGCHNEKHSLRFAFAERLPLVSHAANAANAQLSIEERQRLLEARDHRERSLFQPGHYVGSESCKSCHAQQYEAWSQSAHAHAFDTLRAQGAQSKDECVSCHVTGHKQDGGYPAGGPPLAQVGCESCHGPGGPHVAEGAARKGTILALADKCDSCVVLQICGSCHTEKWSPGFEFQLEAHIEKLRHGVRPVAKEGAQ